MADNLDLGADKEALVRSDWLDFPNVIMHAPQSAVKKHPQYADAKEGDANAAEAVVADCISSGAVGRISTQCVGLDVSLLAVHAVEVDGMNALPRVLAREVARQTGMNLLSGVIQSNRVAHTGASGFHRIAFPALFEGRPRAERVYLIDDFIGQGGTFANLRGFVESKGMTVVGASALTGREDSVILRLQEVTLATLRRRHGAQLEEWWNTTFGYGFEKLTESEARYLINSHDFDVITEKLAQARRSGDRPAAG